MHWGSGHITEEASYEGQYHEPAIQLMEYDNGLPPSVRFCFYSLDGRFQRSPLMLSEEEIDGLRDALRQTPKLRALLRRLVE